MPAPKRNSNVPNKNSMTGVFIQINKNPLRRLERCSCTEYGDTFPEPCDCWMCGGTGCSSCR